jgi:hypothetical protein
MATFRSEAYRSIPLPPELSFEQAFSKLDEKSNSFYLLDLDEDSYIQCGGSASACAVELRQADRDGVYRRYVVVRDPQATIPVHIAMSQGGVWVRQGEVLTVADAVSLFSCFLEGRPLSEVYSLRDSQREPVQGPPVDDGAADVTQGPIEVEDDDTPAVRRLAADDPDNPFGLDGYDCAAFVNSFFSTTADPAIARSFEEGRASTGAELEGRLPDGAQALDCALEYEMDVPLADGVLFRAEAMEDKWDIFLQGNRLAFCRSWTGNLALLADIAREGQMLTVSRVWAPAKAVRDDPEVPVRQVDYLIRSHLLGRKVAHPIPTSVSREANSVGAYSFSVYGRNCVFGSFEDTIEAPDVGMRVAMP